MRRSHTNPDRVTPPVAQLGVVGVILAAVARALIDRYVDPADRELWWNIFQTAVVPGIVLAGAWLGSLRARGNVTPLPTAADDAVTARTGVRPVVPRDRDGNELRPVDHGPAGGYPRPTTYGGAAPPFDGP